MWSDPDSRLFAAATNGDTLLLRGQCPDSLSPTSSSAGQLFINATSLALPSLLTCVSVGIGAGVVGVSVGQMQKVATMAMNANKSIMNALQLMDSQAELQTNHQPNTLAELDVRFKYASRSTPARQRDQLLIAQQ
jgi:hypothetical protein